MDSNKLNDMVFAAFGDSSYQTGQSKHVYKNIKDEQWRLIAIYLTARNVNLFSAMGHPTTVGGPIHDEEFGRYMFADELYFKGMNKMTSSIGIGHQRGEYVAYVFTYIDTENTKEQNKAIKKAAPLIKAAGFGVEELEDPENPSDMMLIVYLGPDFESVLEFDEKFVEGKLN